MSIILIVRHLLLHFLSFYFFFFFNDTATTEIYTLSLHDALPISAGVRGAPADRRGAVRPDRPASAAARVDRKSTRLNSSHPSISYAVFCLKKKKKRKHNKHHLQKTPYLDDVGHL